MFKKNKIVIKLLKYRNFFPENTRNKYLSVVLCSVDEQRMRRITITLTVQREVRLMSYDILFKSSEVIEI